MNRHVLALDLEFHWKDPNLDHLAYIQTDRKGNHVAALFRIPVDQHVWRCTDPPSITRQVNEHASGSELPFVLPQARVARCGKNEAGARSQQPRTGEFRTGRD